MMGSAAFLFPDGRMVPESSCPPWTTNCSAFIVRSVRETWIGRAKNERGRESRSMAGEHSMRVEARLQAVAASALALAFGAP